MPIYTAKTGTNADQFPEILEIYVPLGSKVLDMTYGKGVFWRNVEGYDLYTNDLDLELGEYSYDFADIEQFIANRFKAVVFDPPYASRSSNKNSLVGSMYKNKEHGIATVEGMMQSYRDGMSEAHKLLIDKGILIVKCQDEISSGKQQWNHITILNTANNIGFLAEDLFVMVRSSRPMMRHPYQLHARKNHSFWWIFRKK